MSERAKQFEVDEMRTVFAFSDGAAFLLYDPELDEAANDVLAKEVSAETRRRAKRGASDAGTIRALRIGEKIVNEVPAASAAA